MNENSNPRLARIVKDYIENHRPRAEAELDYFRRMPDLATAVECAGRAQRPDGKIFDHQRRLGRRTLARAYRALVAVKGLDSCQTFHELFAFIESALDPVEGVGELMVYDTSLRLGAHLGLLPDAIYLHAGTQAGAAALGLSGARRTLPLDELPPELQRLPPPREPTGVPPEVADDFIVEFKRRHYAAWPDEPVPALGGLTPRDAAKRPDKRRVLIALLKDFEMTEAGLPEGQRYDVGELRRELGIES